MTDSNSVPERDQISRRIVEITSELIRLRERLKGLAEQDYGLVPDITRVRQEDMIGTFIWVVSYEEPGPPWIRVRLDETIGGPKFRGVNFYGNWEKLPNDG